ncbi:hypothetical protein MOP88_19450 [Sphingomonas sp. WKB10]|nr:hypothetical protein [Sphingomonas sp. WKB10]
MHADAEPGPLAERGIADGEDDAAAASRLAMQAIDAGAMVEQRVGQPQCAQDRETGRLDHQA